jgi:hypothetical protein
VKSDWSRAGAVATVIVALAGLAGCGASQPSNVVYKTPGDVSVYGYAASDGATYFLIEHVDASEDPMGPTELWTGDPGRKALKVGTFTIDGACPDPVVSDLRLLSDGMAGAMVDCDDRHYFATVDLSARPPTGHVVSHLPTYGFTVAWDPTVHRGWAGRYDHRCGAIGALTAKGLGSFRPAGIGWPLDQDLHESGDDTCSGDGLASQPVLAPGGRVLYFIAAPGTARNMTGSLPDWTLYAYDVGSGAVTAVATGLRQVSGFDVAGDGSTIVIGAKLGGTSGLWLINSHTHAATLLSDRKLLDPRFASADQVLAVEQDVDHDALVKLSIS